jgi:signal transduction histidine kinase/CHASE1-domain containing sensor protein/ActR/RegA family two-component response regulator
MVRGMSPSFTSKSLLRTPAAVFLMGILITAGITYLVTSRNQTETEARFERISISFVNSLKIRMTTYVNALEYTRNLFELKPNLDSQEFGSFVRRMEFEKNLPGIQSMGYVKRMPRQHALRILKQLGKKPSDSGINPKSRISNLVIYMEPIASTVRASAVGMDVGVNPTRIQAMNLATDLGEPVATERAQPRTQPAGPNQYLFVVFVPQYKKGMPTTTVAERRKAIQGFVYGGFRASNLFSRVTDDIRVQVSGIRTEIFDGDSTTADALMYSEGSQDNLNHQLQRTISLNESNHQWTVRMTAPNDFGPPYANYIPAMALLIGLGATVLVTALTYRAQNFAFKLEMDIQERRQTEAQLRAKNELVDFTSKVGLSLMSEQDLSSIVQMVTETGTGLVGARFGAFFYNTVKDGEPSFTLGSLHGADPDDFSTLAMPRQTDIFKPIFLGQGIVCSDDITIDPQYGKHEPFAGMPKGHLPIRSFLASPVVSKAGKVLGGLFFGHSSPGIFNKRSEKILSSVAIQAAVAMENASLYQQLRAARQEADAANYAKTMFLANISHEMRTPLGVMIGHAELGLDENDVEKMRESLRIIVKNGRELTQIIGDVLDLSKIEANALQIDESSIVCKQFVEELQTIWATKAEGKGLRFEVKISGNVPESFKADRTRVKQILVNLLSNAVKFTEQGFVRLNMNFQENSSQDRWLLFSVEDSGPGISEAHRSKLFKTFSQVDSSITRKFGGNGLGLALSRQLAQALRGDLQLESSVFGQGSCFVLKLPFVVGEHLQVRDDREIQESSISLAGMKALIVDDSQDNQLLIQLLLKRFGMASDVANNGEEGVKLAIESHYDLILMDLQMPVLDGYGALEKLKSLGIRRPIVAVSAHALKEEKQRALSKGFHAYLTKPIDRRAFLQTLSGLPGLQETSDQQGDSTEINV